MTPFETLLAAILADLGLVTEGEGAISAGDLGYLTRKLRAIIAAAEHLTGRKLLAASWSDVSPFTSLKIYVVNPPIRTLVSVEIDGRTYTPAQVGEAFLVLPATAYGEAVSVTYDGGFAELPADLYDALLTLMADAWASKGSPSVIPSGVKAVTLFDVGSYEFSGETDPTLGAAAPIFERYSLALPFSANSPHSVPVNP